MKANATLKKYGTRVEIIGRDDDYEVYQVLHSDGQIGWGSQSAIVPDSELMAEARAWVDDCEWSEAPDTSHGLSDETIKRGIERHYEGGWTAFVQSCGQEV